MRRLPAPWSVEDYNDACFIVKDAQGQALGFFYYDNRQIAGTGDKLTREEARRLAVNFARLPDLLSGSA